MVACACPIESVEGDSISFVTSQPRRRWTPTWYWRVATSPDLWAFSLIAAAVLLANVLYVSGIFDPNPLGLWTGLGSGLGSATHFGVLPGRFTADPSGGLVSQAFGHLAVHDWFHLQAPWWNPFEGTGTPLAGEMQSAALSPFTIFTAVSNGQLYEHMLFELISGISTYLLLRRLGIARWASTAAAIVFALNGTFAWFTHAPVNVVPFLPLLLLGIESAYAASVAGRRGGWWLIAVAGALSVYAGFPETAYINAMFAGLWVLWRAGCAGRPNVRGFLIKVALGTVCAGLLAAPLLVAFGDYLHVGVNGHVAIGNSHRPGAALPMLLLPYIYGPIFAYSDPAGTSAVVWDSVGGYLSTSLLFFGIVGLVSSRRRGLRLVLLTWIILALARIYGVPGLGAVLGVFPSMSQVAFYRYADPALELAVVIFAALGMDALSARTAPRRLLVAVTFVSIAAVAAAVVRAQTFADALVPASHSVYQRWSVIWAVLVIVVGALAAIVPRLRARQILVAAIVTTDAFALFVLPELSAPRSIRIDTAPVAYLQRHQGLARFATIGPLQPNYGSYFRLRAVNELEAVLPKNFYTYVNTHLDSSVSPFFFTGVGLLTPPTATAEAQLLANLDGYRAAGVRYVLTPVNVRLPAGEKDYKLVFRSPTARIYRINGTSSYFTSTNPSCSVRFSDGDSALVSCPTATTLVRRETYMPGWSASVDGRERPIGQYEGLFQRVTVGPGTHRVTFAFAPPHTDLAVLGFAAGCLLLLGAPLVARMRIRFPSR